MQNLNSTSALPAERPPLKLLFVDLGVAYLWPTVATWQGYWLLSALSQGAGHKAAEPTDSVPLLVGAILMLVFTAATAWAIHRGFSGAELTLATFLTAMSLVAFVFLSFVFSGLGGTMSPESAADAAQEVPRRAARFASLSSSAIPALQVIVILVVMKWARAGSASMSIVRHSVVTGALLVLGTVATGMLSAAL